MIRRARVAGTWYPDDPVRLADEVDRYLAAVEGEPPAPAPRALIAPHAGLVYSGPVAAHAYHAARAGAYDAIVLVGPSHFVGFEGVSIWPEGAWETPFGALTIHADLAASIKERSTAIVDRADAHGREHSLEMQLPYVARLFPNVPIVPLVMGYQTRATAEALGDVLAGALTARVLLVASSDLSHYENARTAASLDGVVIDRVDALDASGLMAALEREPRHACGGGPMVAVMRAARASGAATARTLYYGDSGDVSGDKSSVVGYLAAAIW